MKKILSILLSLLMILCVVSCGDSDEKDEILKKDSITATEKSDAESTEDTEPKAFGMQWSFDESTGILTISGNGDMDSYPYPKKQPWLEYMNSINKVVIEDGITSVGESAFSDCINLMSVDMPQTITKIESFAFGGCETLETVTIPASVIEIGDNAFYTCTNLRDVVLPEGVVKIDYGAFAFCKNLSTITLPDSLTEIGSDVFYFCENLIIRCHTGSYAESYAVKYLYDVEIF